MNRRELLTTTTTAALLVGALRAEAQPSGKPVPVPAKKPHEGHAGHAAAAPVVAANPVLAEVAAAAAECLVTGEACLSHCLRALAQKDDSMAACAATVRDMLAACQATISLASAQSKHLPAMAALCAKICRDCEAECKKHADHHAECKRCMESCARCAAACEKAAKG